MKAVVIGSVISSKIVLEELINTEIEVIKVYSLDEQYAKEVSGYVPIHQIAEINKISYRKFRRINEDFLIQEIEGLSADYIFVIGLSQLVDHRIIQAAKKGTIGFHPTPLPKYRGRAAMVWQVLLGVKHTKCTMFLIDGGMDSGDILGQEDYVIEEEDYASDIEEKLCLALRKLCKRVFEKMIRRELNPIKQDESQASYLLKRTKEDGKIDWNQPIKQVYRLIRGVSRPYPGAFSFYDGIEKLIIWHAQCLENNKYIGMPGQIANVQKDYFDIVCIDGLLRVDEYETEKEICLLVGHKMKG